MAAIITTGSINKELEETAVEHYQKKIIHENKQCANFLKEYLVSKIGKISDCTSEIRSYVSNNKASINVRISKDGIQGDDLQNLTDNIVQALRTDALQSKNINIQPVDHGTFTITDKVGHLISQIKKNDPILYKEVAEKTELKSGLSL